MKKETIVLGLGNVLMGDEGIGVRIVEKLESVCGRYPETDFVDAGTGGMNVLHLMAGRKKAVIVDCCVMGAEAGTMRRFGVEDVATVKQLSHLSLHEVDILKVVEIARRVGECPEEIVFFGVEPVAIEPRIDLSEVLERRLGGYVEQVGEILR
jgi:hydrogenase maturation protease